MTEGISGEASYICEKCGAKHVLRSEDFEFEAVSGSERDMGPETEYLAEFIEPCRKCGNDIHLKFMVWEYPVGAVNYTSEEATGAKIDQSSFEIVHTPEEDPMHEAVKLIKPLLFFRFDQFSELFVEFWAAQYKRAPKTTSLLSIVSVAVAIVSIAVAIYSSEAERRQNLPQRQNFEGQYSLLRKTQENLNDLEAFISAKKGEIVSMQQLLTELEQKKSEIEPIVNAKQEVIDAIFLQQRREFERTIWVERGISFGLGVLASLVASLIWHFVARFRKENI